MAVMKSIGDAVQPWKDSPEADESPALSTRTIEHLFAKFAAIYGTKLADHWAGVDLEKVKQTWAESLGELAREEIVAGIQTMIRAGKPFPPTLPEFYAYCRPNIEVPPASDHAGLDRLARELGVSLAGIDSYHGLRMRIMERTGNARFLALKGTVAL